MVAFTLGIYLWDNNEFDNDTNNNEFPVVPITRILPFLSPAQPYNLIQFPNKPIIAINLVEIIYNFISVFGFPLYLIYQSQNVIILIIEFDYGFNTLQFYIRILF